MPDITTQLLFLAFALVTSFGVVVAQAIALRRVLRSWAWTWLAAGFSVIGLRQLWGLITLPAAILKAKQQVVLPPQLSFMQWMLIALAFLATGLFILGLDRLRRDLRNLEDKIRGENQ